MSIRNVDVDPDLLCCVGDELVDCIEVDRYTLEVIDTYMGEPCHHFMREAYDRIECLVHVLPSQTDLEYMDWLVNESFMSGSLEYVSINNGEHGGVLVHPSKNKNRFGAMCVAVRMGWEFTKNVQHIMRLGKRIGDTDSAFFIAQCYSGNGQLAVVSDDAHKAVYPSKCKTLSVVKAITNPDEYWQKTTVCKDAFMTNLQFSSGFGEEGDTLFTETFGAVVSKYVSTNLVHDEVNPFGYPIDRVSKDGVSLIKWKDVDKETWASIKKEIIDAVQ